MARSGVVGAGQPQGDAQQRVQDLQQLQREYRHMELNRRAYAEESQQLLRKQQVSCTSCHKLDEISILLCYNMWRVVPWAALDYIVVCLHVYARVVCRGLQISAIQNATLYLRKCLR